MKQGYLSNYFKDIAIKKLSAVEIDSAVSNQHEFNSTGDLKKLFGTERLTNYPVTFIWLGADEFDVFSADSTVTWYDAREKHPTRSEWRLYFKGNNITHMAEKDDILIVARRSDDKVVMIIINSGSTFENQLLWLFGIQKTDHYFKYHPITGDHDTKISFPIRYILQEIGIEITDDSNTSFLDRLIEPYINKGFPDTKEFSKLAEESVEDSDPIFKPDITLLKWMDQEERLFKRLEKHIVTNRLNQGFVKDGITDVDNFIQFSLSVHNRRKARVGHAFENHLQSIFNKHNIKHSRGQYTENKSKPDFLFPGVEYYQDNAFPSENLTMLGAKSSCKDRWRQVLAEASRIKQKHLVTLEPGISTTQTNEMKTHNLQLIIPSPLHDSFKESQRQELMNLSEFIDMVKKRQR